MWLLRYNFYGCCEYLGVRDGKDASVGTISVFCMPIRGKNQGLQIHWRNRIKMIWKHCPGWRFCGSTWASCCGSSGDTQWWLIPASRLSLCSRTLGCSGGPGGSLLGVISPRGVGGDTSAFVRQMECAERELAFNTALLEWACEGQTMKLCPSYAFGSGCHPGAAACPGVGQKDRATPASPSSVFPVRQPLSLLHEGCSLSALSFWMWRGWSSAVKAQEGIKAK